LRITPLASTVAWLKAIAGMKRKHGMKALAYRRFGSPDVLEWAEGWSRPTPAEGQVLVRVAAGSVNPKDVLLRQGRFHRTLARDPLPRVTGLDAAGKVAEVGDGVDDLAPGDGVFGMSNRFCGGVLAEYALFDRQELGRAPECLSPVESAAVPLAALTALQALRDLGRLEPGQSLLINGASGGVGHFAVQIGRIMGADVHAVCGPSNAGFVTQLGAAQVHDYSEASPGAIDHGFNVVFDVFGNLDPRLMARQLGREGIFISTVPRGRTIGREMLARLGLGRRRLVLVRSRRDDLERLGCWIDRGALRPHIDRVYAPENGAEAHRHVERKHTAGKVVIALPDGS
jgi:NADPH:quinone reductase-like Zn-dependent oxidoreductase